MSTEAARGAGARRVADHGRRSASYLYGMIVGGAALATAPEEFGLARVVLRLVGTLVIYWAAETYVHWIAARTHAGRRLTPAERHAIVRDGLPLVAACGVPVAFLAVEALLGVEAPLAVDLALALNALLLFVVGWRMGRAGALRGVALLGASAAAGILGIALIGLKIVVSH